MIAYSYRIKALNRVFMAWGNGKKVFAVSLDPNEFELHENRISKLGFDIEIGSKKDTMYRELISYFKTGIIENLKPVYLWGTDFQRKIWSEIYKLKQGETITYRELAERIGCPKSARAAGNACGANPIPLIVPCHRIVASDGIGGFGGAPQLKRELLNLERITRY